MDGFPEVMSGIETGPSLDSPVLNEKDRPILATAIRHKCQILLTDDKRVVAQLFGRQIETTMVFSPLMLKDVLERL